MDNYLRNEITNTFNLKAATAINKIDIDNQITVKHVDKNRSKDNYSGL